MSKLIREFFLIWLIGFCVIGGFLLIAFPVKAHDAPSGWSYPIQCCSGADCREVDGPEVLPSERKHSVQIIRIDGGYQISTTGERIMDGDPKIKDSPDGVHHWCSQRGADDTPTICIFRPPPLF